MKEQDAIRRFWDIFESHRHILYLGEAYDPDRFRAAKEGLREALRPFGGKLDLDLLREDGLMFVVQNHGLPSMDKTIKAIIEAAPGLKGWQFAWQRSWLPEDGFSRPDPDPGDPAFLDQVRVRMQPVRTKDGPPGFHLWFFLPPSAMGDAEEILYLLPLVVGDPGYDLIHFVHYEPLGALPPAGTSPFRPCLEWARWINPFMLNVWEPIEVGLDEPGLTTPTCPF
jgi:hypothetical protein